MREWLEVVDAVRAALAEASRRDIADRVPAGLLPALVANGHWTLDEAVGLARRKSAPDSRVEALVSLASLVDGSVAARLWTEAICVGYLEWRRLAPRLPASLYPQALDAVAGIPDIGDRIAALGILVPHLPVELMPSAFEVVEGIGGFDGGGEEGGWLAEALCQVAGRLPLDLVPGAFRLADGLPDDAGRIDALLCLSAYLPAGWPARLPAERRPGLVAELAAARAAGLLFDESQDVLWQELFTELLPPELRTDAVAAAAGIDPEGAAFLLAGLSPRLPADLLGRAREVAEVLPDEPRARALIGILPYLLDDTRLPELAGVLTDLASGHHDEPPAWIRRSLVPRAPGDRAEAVPLTATWAAVTALPDGWQRDYLIARLSPRLPDDLLPDAVARLAGTPAARDAGVVGGAVAALAPRLSEPLLAQAWEAATAIGDPTALTRLAPHLPISVIPSALRDASRLPLRSSADGEHVRFAVLRGIAPRLPDELIPEAVQALVPVTFDDFDLSGHRGEAAGVLANLVGRLTARRHDILNDALHRIASLDDRAAKAQALSRIAALLPEGLVPEAFAIAVGLRDEAREALHTLASRAPGDLLLATYARLSRIGDAQQIAAVRAGLTSVEPAHGEPALSLTLQALRIPHRSRAECLAVVADAVRSLAASGPKPAIDACAAAIDEVRTRWP